MKTLEDIRKLIRLRWQGAGAERVALSLLDRLSAQTSRESSMLTYAALRRFLSNENIGDKDFYEAVTYLCTPEAAVLEMEFLYVDDDGKEHQLGKRDIYESQVQGFLVDPISGEEVKDFEDRVIPYFVPSSILASAKRQ